MGVDEHFQTHLRSCFSLTDSVDGLIDLMGAKCLIYRLTGRAISRREIYEAYVLMSGSAPVSSFFMSLEAFEGVLAKLREKHFITEATLVNNLYGALDEGRRGYVDEAKLAKCMIKAMCPQLATAAVNDAFARADELNIGRCSITQTHALLRKGAAA
jgi:hypothetical protein